jgi:hypothetical protein
MNSSYNGFDENGWRFSFNLNNDKSYSYHNNNVIYFENKWKNIQTVGILYNFEKKNLCGFVEK